MIPSNEPMLTAAELVARLHSSPERVVARMSYQEQKALLERVLLGTATISEAAGAALLDALRLMPDDLGAAIQRIESIRRRNIEGRQAWEKLQVIDAAMKEPIALLNAKAVEVFGPEWELVRPIPFYVDWDSDRVEVQNAPVLQPLADAVTAAMQGRNALSRIAQMIEDQVRDVALFELADRRHELAVEAARRAS